jgi:hypothetical protein
MSGAELKSRRVPKVNMSTANGATNQSKAKALAVTWQEILNGSSTISMAIDTRA